MKTFLILMLALLTPISTSAMSDKTKKHFAGVWQQTQMSKKDHRIMRLPVWKVMQNDNSFCTFLIANQSGQSIITNEGSYKITSDSTFVEHITGSITDPELIGNKNKITYRFDGKDKMHISYRMPGALRDGHETWIRVKLEMPE